MEAARELVLARLYLMAVIPLLEDIALIDSEVQEAIKEWNIKIQFRLAGGEHVTTLAFGEGKLTAIRGNTRGPCVTLTFKDAGTLNEIFQGRSQKSPRPNLMGLFHLKKLQRLDAILKKIEHYVKPAQKLLEDPQTFEHCVRLTLYALAYGVKEVGEYDPEMKPLAGCLPNGTLEIGVTNGPAAHIGVRDGAFFPARGRAQEPAAYLELADLQTAWDLIQGKLDQFAAIGGCRIKMRGLIPLIDGINPILGRLSLYLAG